jgi:hypothetical protein
VSDALPWLLLILDFRRQTDSLMSNRRLFLVALLTLLAFAFLERWLREHLVQVPAVFDLTGALLAVGSLPWSLAALALFRETTSPLVRVLRDLAYLLVLTGGVALNLVLLRSALAWIISRWRGG